MKLNRISKVAIGVAAACGVYSALGFWGAPAAIKWAASGPLTELTGRNTSVGEVKFNPWTLELTLNGIQMAGHAENEPPLAVKHVYANAAGWSSLMKLGVVLDALQVSGLSGQITVNSDGTTSFEDIVQNIQKKYPPTEDKEDSGVFKFCLNNIELSDSAFRILVPAHNVDENLTEIKLGIPFIGSIGSDREIYVKPELSLKDNGSPFALHGQSLPFTDSKATNMHFDIEGYDLAHLGKMLPIRADIAKGSLSGSIDLTFAEGLNGSADTLKIGFSAEARDFSASMKGDDAEENHIAFSSLKITEGLIDLGEKSASVKSVELASPDIALARRPDGTLVWADIAAAQESGTEVKAEAKAEEKTDAAGTKTKAGADDEKPEGMTAAGGPGTKPASETLAETKPEESTPFKWLVQNVSVTGGSVKLFDHAANETIAAASLNASAENLTAAENETSRANIEAKTLGGNLRANSEFSISALSGKAHAEPSGISLKPVSGYLKAAGIGLEGVLSGTADAAFETKDAFTLKANGNLSLKEPLLTISGGSPVSLRMKELKTGNFTADYGKTLGLTFDRLQLASPSLDIPKSDFAAKFGAIDGKTVSVSWNGSETDVGFKSGNLLLKAGDVRAAKFTGLFDSVTGDALQIGWNGKKDLTKITGRKLSAAAADLSAGAFSGKIAASSADSPDLVWNGKKQLLTFASGKAAVGSTDFTAAPVSGGFASTNVAKIDLSLDTNENGVTSLTAGALQSEQARFALEGTLPINLKIAKLDVTPSALKLGPSMSFDTESVSSSGLDIASNLIRYGASAADLKKIHFAQNPDTEVTLGTVHIAKGSMSAPVNAAVVTSLTESVDVAGFDFLDGENGHINLESADTRSTSYAISEGKTTFSRVEHVGIRKVAVPKKGTISVESVLIEKPRTQVSRDESGNLDIDPLLGKRESAEEAKKDNQIVKQQVEAVAKKAGLTPQPVRVGEFKITNAGFTFNDRSIKPAGVFRFSHMDAEVKPVVIGGENTPSNMKLTAQINGVSKLEITGSGSPFVDKGKLVAKSSLTAVSMPFFSPYTMHYVSYPIQKGNLTVNSDITMWDKTYLKIENHAKIEKLTWGPYIPNDTSVSLPVTLATTLLTDKNGDIEFNLPVEGNLADPNFSFTDLILTGLKNLIVKVVAAPVNIVMSVVTVPTGLFSSAPSVFIPYLSGDGRLTAEQQKETIPQIVKMLKENPKARVEITPVTSLKSDEEPLHQKTYSGLLKLVQSTMPESERNRENVVNQLFAMQFPDDKTTTTASAREQKLYEAVKPDGSTLIALATRRSNSMSKMLTDAGVPPERIFVTAPEMDKTKNLGGVKLVFSK